MRLELVVPLLLSCLVACSRETPPPLPLRPVLVQTLGGEVGGQHQTYTGEVRSRTETALAFQVGGKIMERRVDVGDTVKAGQVLARLDPVDQALNLAAVEANLALAEAEAARYEQLKSKNFVSQAALDVRESNLKAARAQAALARNQRGYTDLKAEQTGVIAQVAAEVGQVVAPGQMVFRLARPDEPEVAVALPETRVSNLRVGDGARVSLWSDGGASFSGRVREIGPVADTVTRTYPVRVSILEAEGKLHLGMTATVELSLPDTGLLLPAGAIFQQGERPAVWVVGPDDTVRLQVVTVGAWLEEGARISGGVSAGQRVVVAGAHKLTAGEKIQPVEGRP